MNFPKTSMLSPQQVPQFEQPGSIFDLINFRLSEFLGVSGSLVTRICENEFGITREEWQFVAMLADLDDMSPSDLADRTTVDRSQASKTLRALMNKGLVDRKPVPGDGRKAQVSLTQSGADLYAKLFPRVVQLHNEVLQDLDPSQRQALANSVVLLQARAVAAAQNHKPEGAAGRRQGGSRLRWNMKPRQV
jgi:DNA-binding MarR family transcriptional regulator